MQEVFFFFDDSGVFHKNEPSGYFVYAGYVFTDRKTIEDAKRKYINANKKIKNKLNRMDELKAANLQGIHKRSLFNVLKEYDKISAVVKLSEIYDYIIDNKKSICRYKDYILKRCVKQKLKQLISENKISSEKDIRISINIDEQLTATNGYYDLRDSIKEEMQFGIENFNYGIVHTKLFNSNVEVIIKYCDSSKNYMIQASDILANRIWKSYRTADKQLRTMMNNTILTFP